MKWKSGMVMDPFKHYNRFSTFRIGRQISSSVTWALNFFHFGKAKFAIPEVRQAFKKICVKYLSKVNGITDHSNFCNVGGKRHSDNRYIVHLLLQTVHSVPFVGIFHVILPHHGAGIDVFR
jgi:hypothetical protein